MSKSASPSKPCIVLAAVALLAAFALAASVASPWAEPAWAASDGPTLSVTRAATGKLVMKKGSSYKLAAKASAGKLTYKSSKKKIVSVTKKGVLKAKKPGSAKITVTAKKGSKKAVKEIRVKVVKPKKYKAAKKVAAKVSSCSIQVGDTAKVSVSFKPMNASNKNVTFKSSNPRVASVAPSGTVTALKPGTAKITVKSCANNKRASVSVTVKARLAGDVQQVKYADGVQAVSSRDAKVAANGKSATVDPGALGSRPKAGQIVAIVDDELQGTSIKVTSVSQNADGTYTVKGTKPEFDEVFADLHVERGRAFSESDVTWVAKGVHVEDASDSEAGLATQAVSGEASVGMTESKKTFKPGTLKFTFTQEFWNDESLPSMASVKFAGNLTLVYTPVLEYGMDYTFPRLKRMKLLLSEEQKVTLDGKLEGKIEVPIATLCNFATVFFVVGVDGKVTLAYKESRTNGIDYRSGKSGSPFVHSTSSDGSLKFAATGRVGVGAEAGLKFAGLNVCTLRIEGGGRGRWTPSEHYELSPHCADVMAWVYAEGSYKLNNVISELSGIGGTGKWEALNETNSPVRYSSHFENGEPVSACTQTDSGDDPGPGGDPDPGDDPSVDPTPHDGDIASGTCGTCPWRITADGCLIVGAGELQPNSWTWLSNSQSIKSVQFNDGVLLSGEAFQMFYKCSSLTSVDGLANWDTSKVTTMTQMFRGCSSLVDVDALSGWDTSSVKSMGSMFANCSLLVDVDAFSEWDTSSVEYMEQMFYECSSLTSAHLPGWNTSSVIYMQHMFYNCASLASVDLSGWDTSSVTNMRYMFCGCRSLADVSSLSGWDTSSVINMEYMFADCRPLVDVGALSGWNTSSVTDMSGMFYECTSLASVGPLSGWDTSSVTNMSSVFYYCSSLASVDALSGWDTSSVTSMSGAFSRCTSLASVDALSGWGTSSVANMRGAFYWCTSLASVDALSGWDTSSVTDMARTFYKCTSLTSVDALSGWNTSKVNWASEMFAYCTSLASVDALAGWDMSSATHMSSMFDGCPLIESYPAWYKG